MTDDTIEQGIFAGALTTSAVMFLCDRPFIALAFLIISIAAIVRAIKKELKHE